MHVHLIGTGAVGGLYGGLLARAGAQVTVQCRSDYATVRTHGIRIESLVGLGDWIFTPDHVIREGETLSSLPDIVILAVKVNPSCDRIALIKPMLSSETVIVSISNGLGVDEDLMQAFPDHELVGGVAFVCATRIHPGHVLHQAYGHLVLGRYPAGKSRTGVELVNLWQQSGASAEYSPNLAAVRWQKSLWNASFSAICTISNTHTADVLGCAEALVRRVMEEIHVTATQLGHELPLGIIEKQINGTHRMPAYYPSMYLDRAMGNPTEVEAIIGNAVRISREIGVKTPHLDTLYSLLKLQEHVRLDPLKSAPKGDRESANH